MESSLRHILHFSNSDDIATTDHGRPEAARNLSINELSQVHDHQPQDGLQDMNGDENGGTTNPSRKRPNPQTRLSYPRKRAIRACQKCRVRRTKCDNVRPACTACLDLGAECIYSEGDPSTFDTASLAILEKLNTIEDLLRRPSLTPPQPLSPPRPDLNVVQTPASIPSVLSAAAPEKPVASTRKRMSIETVLSWQAFTELTPDLDLKGLLTSHDIGRSGSTDIIHHEGNEEQLLQRFLDTVFIYNPVLEEAVLHQYLREIQYHGLKWDAKSCLCLLIWAHGYLSHSEEIHQPVNSLAFRRTPEFSKAEHLFEAASKRMGVLLCSSTLVEAQCFFLAGVYLMATLRPLEAWKMFVQALTCCQAFTPEHKLADEAHEREQKLQESIYWTCFKSELELRLELNVFEHSIWDLTYPAFYPSPHEDIGSQRQVVWLYYLAEIALRRLGNRILNFFHKHEQDRSKPDIEAVAGFEQQAADWQRSLPPVLNFEITAQSPGGDLAQSLKFILDGHLLDCYEMLYWPFLTEIILHGHSTSNIPALEQLAYKSLHVCVQRIHKNEHGFFARHHGTWLMLRSCTRSALVLLAARKDSVLVNLMPEGWEGAIWKVVSMLRFWKDESRDCDDRLRIIEKSMHDIEMSTRRTST